LIATSEQNNFLQGSNDQNNQGVSILRRQNADEHEPYSCIPGGSPGGAGVEDFSFKDD